MYKFKMGNLNKRLLSLCLFVPSIVFGSVNQEYVDAVKLDFEEFSTGTFKAPENSTWMPTGKKASVDGTDSLESFSQFLQKRFPGTFILYKKLDDSQKTAVWKDYVNTGDLGGIRSNIFSMRRSSRAKANR